MGRKDKQMVGKVDILYVCGEQIEVPFSTSNEGVDFLSSIKEAYNSCYRCKEKKVKHIITTPFEGEFKAREISKCQRS